jgi:hypothetical protein
MWPQCGAGRARKADSLPQRSVIESPCKASPKSGTNCRLPIPRRRHFSAPGWLTKTGGAPYIGSLGRAAAWRDGASAKPLTVHTVTEHPAMLSWPCSRRCVECAGFCCLRPLLAGVTGRRGCEVPGCLTGESEERETWTAESLRAASVRGNLARKWPGRDFGGRRFRSTPGHGMKCH